MPIRYDPRMRLLGGPRNALVSLWSNPSILGTSLVQGGTIALTATTTNTATINSVLDVGRAFVTNAGINNSYSGVDLQGGVNRVVLTNVTTVTATCYNGGANTVMAYFVTAYVPGVMRSVQTGTITIASPTLTGTATIASVNTSRTRVEIAGWAGSSGTAEAIYVYQFTLVLTNATTITLTRQASGVGASVAGYYQAPETF